MVQSIATIVFFDTRAQLQVHLSVVSTVTTEEETHKSSQLRTCAIKNISDLPIQHWHELENLIYDQQNTAICFKPEMNYSYVSSTGLNQGLHNDSRDILFIEIIRMCFNKKIKRFSE